MYLSKQECYLKEINMSKVNKLVATTDVLCSNYKAHTFNMCKDSGYYFTINGIKLDWSFPSVSYNSALWHYNNICNDPEEVTNILNWALGG